MVLSNFGLGVNTTTVGSSTKTHELVPIMLRSFPDDLPCLITHSLITYAVALIITLHEVPHLKLHARASHCKLSVSSRQNQLIIYRIGNN